MRARIAEVLADVPRPGAPPTFTAEQIVHIIALACTPPADSGRPVDAWTPRALATEAAKRQIVPSISARSVGRFLRQADLKPHLSRYWLNTTEPDPVAFAEDVKLNIHQSVRMVDLVAKHCGLTEEVTQLRAQGGLKAMASRAS